MSPDSATYDGNGNLIAYVDMATGAKSATYEYGTFGETLIADGVAAEAMPFRFSTKYQDTETGFYNYGYRIYQPSTGRWLSRDPMEEAGGANLYGFVSNDPINYVDPLGLARRKGESRSACMDRFLKQYYGPSLSVIDDLGLYGLVGGAFAATAGQEVLSRTAEKLAERGLATATRDAQIAGALRGGSIGARLNAAAAAGARVTALRAGLAVVGKATGAVSVGATFFSAGARAAAYIDCASEEDSPCNKK